MKDPGLLTDSTGDGMAGMEDVSLETQQYLKKTVYNGSKACSSCGYLMNPVEALHTSGKCPTCSRRSQQRKVKGGMV